MESVISRNESSDLDQLHKSLLDSVPRMIADFMASIKSDSISDWKQVVNNPSPFLTIHQSHHSAFAYKIHGHLHTSAETAFDFLGDVEQRPSWDQLMEESRILCRLDDKTRVVYIRMKAIWPTSSRDLVLLSHLCSVRYGPNQTCYLNVTRTISHPMAPSIELKSTIRMESKLAGQLIRPMGNGKCDILQLADGNPGGWIPSSVLNFVATQALPNSMKKLDKILSGMNIRHVSDLLPAKDDPIHVGLEPPLNEMKEEEVEMDKERINVENHVSADAQVTSQTSMGMVQKVVEKASPWLIVAVFGITIFRLIATNK